MEPSWWSGGRSYSPFALFRHNTREQYSWGASCDCIVQRGSGNDRDRIEMNERELDWTGGQLGIDSAEWLRRCLISHLIDRLRS